jgi:anti-anti-sigma factor
MASCGCPALVVVVIAVSLLEISVEAGTSGPVVRLSGESDLSTAVQLSDALTAQIASGARHLVIDLSALRFADSATIKAFTAAHLALNDAGGTLELLSPQPAVARTLSLLGVDQVIAIRGKAATGDQPVIP